MQAHFTAMASYNRWANARLYADAGTLSADDQMRDIGVYFGSIFKTLAHLLNTDRAWTFILRGGALKDMRLPEPPADFAGLKLAREAQDELMIEWIGGVNQDWLDQPFAFRSGLPSLQGLVYEGTHGSTLTHLFNHQTHHRGQAHAALTILGVREPQGLDMLIKGFLGE